MTELQAMPDIAGWDATVDAYVAYAERDTGAFAAPMLAFADIRPHEHALDVAAGTGALTLPLVDAGARVTAIDWSPGMAAYLRRRLDERDPGHRHAVHAMDGQALAFDDAFDAALSLFGVMLFPDFRAGLAEMARVTRPGGRCVVGSWAGPTAPMRLLQEAAAAALPDLPSPPPRPRQGGYDSGAGARRPHRRPDRAGDDAVERLARRNRRLCRPDVRADAALAHAVLRRTRGHPRRHA